jgi:hypothetical protein
MGNCNLCDSIPFDGDGLPVLPDEYWGHQTSWRYIHQFFGRTSDTKLIKFEYHQNLESLKSFAIECSLCRLVLRQVEKAIEELLIPNPDNLRRGSIDIPKPPTWKLWLTKRRWGDGFYVFTDCKDSKDFCFVAAIGICVKEGMTPRCPVSTMSY